MLPHISGDERKMLIGELAKENSRQYDAFCAVLNHKKSRTNHCFWRSVLLIILFVSLIVFFSILGKEAFAEKLIQTAVILCGGGGLTTLYLFNNGYLSQPDD